MSRMLTYLRRCRRKYRVYKWYEVPHYSTYNNTNFPHINEYRKRLDRLSLKDPHIRNFAYKFDPKMHFMQTPGSRLWKVSRPGILCAFPLTVCIIALEEGYSFFKHGHTSWRGGH